MDDSELEQLLNAQAYPHEAADIQLIETHISRVLLTGDTVYKIKKPLDFGFLDFSTLERRRHFCEEELRLNRRFAPELYLGVTPVVRRAGRLYLGGEGEVVDYAVRMRQFDQSALLDRQLADGRFAADDAAALGAVVATMHESLPVVRPERAGTPGSPESLQAAIVQNFEQIAPYLVDAAAERERLATIADWSKRHYRDLAGVLRERGAAGHVRECHGDLHLGNIARLDGRFLPFDCIEFNDAFRIFDLQGEINFLCMDLEQRGCEQAARRCFNAYLEQSGDYAGVALAWFYRCYFAMVRAKVTLLAAPPPLPEDAAAWPAFRRYHALAERYTRRPPVHLYLTHGVTGSGKSTVAQALIERVDAVRIRADVERKRLFGLRAEQSSGSGLDTGIYTAEASERTYAELSRLARLVLDAGQSCVVDATFLDRRQRRRFIDLAAGLDVGLSLVDCQAPPDVLRARVAARASGEPSEADLSVLDRQLEQRDELDAAERQRATAIDTSNPDWLSGVHALVSAADPT
jgi:hypothetical protein